MRKKPKKGLRKRNLLRAGICFEALEPRLLLSGSWGAVVDGPGPDAQADAHGSLTQGSVVFHTDAGITGAGNAQDNLTPGRGRVDLLSRAPALNTLGIPVPVLDASAVSIPIAPVTGHTPAPPLTDQSDAASNTKTFVDTVDTAVRRELVLVNNDVADYEQLIADLQGRDNNRIIEVVVLESDRDGIEQVSEILSEQSDLSAVHFITHGANGQINLGDSWLNSATLAENSEAVANWGNALADTGDILFYGCKIAADVDGTALLDNIAELTRADVTASDDPTGNAQKGGDWELEYQQGEIETIVAVSSQTQSNWSGVLAFTVDTVADTADAVPGNGLAQDSSGDTSLRAAVEEANALAGADVITLGAGTYTLSLGEITISSDITIAGAGVDQTFIDGATLDRIFNITSGTVTISNLTIQGGLVSVGEEGGGIAVASGASVTLDTVTITNNHAAGAVTHGGGIFNAGTLTVNDSTISDNSAESGGGGLWNEGTADISRSLFTSNNISNGSGGAIYQYNTGSLDLTNVTLSGNTSTGNGGGIYSEGPVRALNITVTKNESTSFSGGGIRVAAGNFDLINSIVAGNLANTSTIDFYGTVSTTGYNIIGDSTGSSGFGGTDHLNEDPLLDLLADNGGLTQTHALLAGSPAINNGNSVAAPLTDQLGNTRDASPDIGAFEYGAAPILTISGADTTDPGSVYTLNLSTTQPGITSWTIDWGDGTTETIAGSPSAVTHVYNGAGFTYNILAAASDGSSTYFESTLLVPSYSTNDGLVRYEPTSGDFLQQFAAGDGLTDPYEVIVGPDGNIYVGGYGSDNVLRYDSSGNFIDEFVISNSGGLNQPVGLAFGPDGNLYVGSNNTDSVLRYDGATGAFIDSFASGGGLSDPMSIVFGPDGNLYVAGFSSNNVVRYDGTTGAFIDVFTSGGSLTSPEDMAFGPDGNLYITSPTSNEVLFYNGTTGAFIDVFTSGVSPNGATGLAFSPDGYLYVSSYYGDNVLRFDATTGGYVDEYFAAGSGGLDGPTYLNFVPGQQVTVTADIDTTLARRVAADSDDAEEEGPTGTTPNRMWLDSSDIELVSDFDSPAAGVQKIGLRFAGMDIPVGATITDAYLVFRAVSADPGMTNSDATSLTLKGQLIGDAPTFTSTSGDISSRTLTNASTIWAPTAWTTGSDYNSPDIASVVQEIVNQGTWASGNDIAIIITGTGHRASQAYDSDSATAAQLVVTYTPGAATNTAPELNGAGIQFTAITEDPIVNNGDLISAMLASAGDPITDVDAGAVEGIAIFDLSNSNGTWQYNIGTGWTAVGSVSVSNSLLLRDSDSLRFVPNADWNGDETITFVAWDQTSGAAGTKVDTSSFGGTTAFSIGMAIPRITVTAVNDNPTVTNMIGDVLNYAEGDGTVVIEQGGDALVSDVDSSNFSGGSLNVEIDSGLQPAEDVFSIRNQGTTAGLIGVSGSDVTYGGSVIGTYTGGTGLNPLTITFNANATAAAVTALVQNITYENTNNSTPTAGARGVTVDINDGDGGGSQTQNLTINVTAVNDAPVITSNGGGATAAINVAENTTAVTTVTSTDVDGGSPSYSILLGDDAASFMLNATTGLLSFLTAPDYENPVDVGLDNVYVVSVQVADGNGGTDVQTIAVTVTDITSTLTVSTVADTANGDTSSIESLNADKGTDGEISLREAIIAANNTAGTDTITFNIAGAGPHTINITSALPAITDAVIIDGTSEPDYSGTPAVQIDGAAAGFSGISIGAGGGGSTIQGLMITGFTVDGINVASGANNVTITDNWIGTAGTGTTGYGNSGVGNSDDGIDIAGSSAIISRNVITNNHDEGITIVGSGATGHLIQGNYIGLDPDGSTGDGNYDVGIAIISGTGNTIGGTSVAARNVISKNLEGIEINTSNNIVQGNYIGTDAGGTLNRGNRLSDGVEIQGSPTGNLIGGETAGAGNLIAFNAHNGVDVVNGTNNSIVRNSIHSNTLLGINLGSGANSDQNFPVLTSAVTNGSQITITGTLNSTASTNFRIEFYSNTTGDPTGYGEGQTLIGISDVTTDGFGNATFSPTFSETVSAGSAISAIVSRLDAGDMEVETSEFAQNAIATAAVNNAPVLDNTKSPMLTAQNEDSGAPSGAVGTLISALVDFTIPAGQVDNVTDADSGALLGIAVTAADTTSGAWWYSTNNGTNWNALGAVSDANTRLLSADASTRLYFQPNANFNGTIANAITFRAWDQTTGTNGELVDTSSTSGTVLDRFSVQSYDNNDGSLNWTSDWIENDSGGGGASSGQMQIVTATEVLAIGAGTVGDWISREANLSGATSATLSFSLDNRLVDAGGQIVVQASDDGGASFTTLAGGTITNATADGVLNFDISAYIAATTQIRFYVQGVAGQHIRIDDVQISVTQTGNGGTTAFSTISDNASLVVNAVNDAPSVTTTGTTLAYTEGDSATAIDTGLTLSDVDSPTLASATVRVISGFSIGEDVLAFTNQLGITGSYNATTGILSLTGSASVADYQTALRTVTYENTSEMPSTTNRTIIFLVNDGTANSTSSRTVSVASINDDPTNAESLPTDLTVLEGVSSGVDLSAVDFADLDHNNQLLTVTLTTSTGGRLYASTDMDVIVSGSGGTIMTLQGGISNLNSFFNSATRIQYLHTNTNLAGNDVDTIQVQIRDNGNTGDGGGVNIDLGTVNVGITSVNDAPSGTDKTVTTNEDTDYTFSTADFGFSDVNDSPANSLANIVIATAPTNGTLYVDTNGDGTVDGGEALVATNTVAVADITAGRLKFKPVVDANGTSYDSFTFKVRDDGGVANSGIDTDSTANTITIDVTAVNDAPTGVVASNFTQIDEDDFNSSGKLVSAFTTTTADPDTGAVKGIAVIAADNSNGAWEYTLDGTNWFAIGNVSASSARLLPSNGTARVRFVPNPDYNGVAFPFTVVAWDQTTGIAGGLGDASVRGGTTAFSASSATVGQTVNAINDAPVNTIPGTQTVNEETTTAINGISISDVDANGANLTTRLLVTNGVLSVTLAGSATISAGSNGTNDLTILGIVADINATLATLTYTGNLNVTGIAADTLIVRTGDGGNTGAGGALQDTDNIQIDINPLNDVPVAADDSGVGFSTNEDTGFTTGNVLTNDSLGDAPTTITAFDATSANGASVVYNNDGTFTYTPAANVNGNDTFTYTITDTDGETSTATVTIAVAAVNDVPVASADSGAGFSTNEDTGFTTGDVLSNDTLGDPPTTITAFDATSANGATVAYNNDGTFTYTPAAGFNGNDTFTYTITDTDGETSTATVTIAVGAVNDVPVAADDSGVGFSTNEDTGFTTGNVLTNDSLGDAPTTITAFDATSANGASVVYNNDGTFTYTPAANVNGNDTFTYTITDTDGETSTATVTIAVAAVNDVPVASADSGAGFSTNEDTGFTTGDVLSNDTLGDPPTTITAFDATSANGATVAYNNDGTFTYTPAAGFNGNDTFTYTITDTDGETSTATVTIAVGAVNDVPVAADDSGVGFSTNEDTGFTTGNVLTNDSLGDAPTTITAFDATSANGASVVYNNDGTFTYTPAANVNGNDTFTYTITDTDGETSTATVTIAVAAVNDVPVASADSGAGFSTNEDTGFTTGDVLSNDTLGDPPTTITAFDATSANGATVAYNNDGTFTYTPAAGFNGNDTFTYTITDTDGETSTATVTIAVGAVNDVPVAADDSGVGFSTNEDTGFTTGNVLTNDSLGDAPTTITAFDATSANGASVVYNNDGTFTYTPAANVNGNDTFTYTITDTDGETSTATVTIAVAAVNDVPVASADSGAGFSTNEDTGFTTGDVLSNDTLGDPPTTITAFDATSANGATVAYNNDGTFTYTPAAGFNGNDTFTYTITDTDGETSTATVTIAVGAVNDVPVAADDSGVGFSTNEDTGFTTGNVLTNDSLGDAPTTITAFDATSANGASVVYNNDGTFTYTPAANVNGNDTFTYTITDTDGETSTATVTIAVAAVNDVPVASADSGAGFSTNEDTGFTTGDVLSNDTLGDPPTTITAFDATSANGATVAYNNDGTFTYTPAAGFNGNDTFTYTITDTDGETSTATVTIAVGAVNDVPVAADDSGVGFSTNEDTGFTTGNVLTNDSLGDAPTTITAFDATSANGASVVYNNDGTFTYTPAANVNGNDTFTYTITDTDGETSTATVTIAVAAVNDVPVASADSGAGFSTNEDTGFTTGDVLSNDTLGDPPTTITAFDATSANGATVAYNNDGTFTYTPAAGFNGNDTFTYTITDTDGETSTATVTIAVGAVNDVPVAADDSGVGFSTNEDTGFTTGNVLTNDSLGDAPTTITAFDATSANGASVVYNNDGTFTYTPAANVNGNDTFTYTITDTDGETSTATVTIAVAAVNDVPVASADSGAGFSTNEDTGFTTGDVLSNDTLGDPPTTITAFDATSANGATVAYNNDGTFTYTPAAGFNGNDTFTYTITDTDGETSTATVTIAVGAVNDVPVAADDSGVGFSTNEDTGFTTGNVLTNDSLGDAPTTITAFDATSANGASVVYNNDGTFTYTPAANVNGNDTFTYTITDTDGETSTATVTIAVAAVNDVPVASADSGAGFSTNEDTGFTTGDVLSNDTLGDPPTTITAFDATSANGATVAYNNDGTFTYTPAAGFNGNDTFTYTITDTDGETSTATVTIAVGAVNDVPVAADDSGVGFSTNEDTGFTTGNVLTNDSLGDAPTTITAFDATSANGASVVYNNDGTFTYTPAANVNGNDTFTYTITDTDGETSTATVTIAVAAVNDVPVASADSGAGFSTNEDTGFTTGDVLSNDTLGDPPTTITAFDATSANGATVAYNNDGTFTYTPAAGFNGNDTFTYTITDTDGETSTATVTIAVGAVNDVPVAADDSGVGFSTNEDTGFTTGNVLTNDSLGDAPTTITAFDATSANGASVVYNNDGTFTYTPAANVNGNDTFTYTITDTDGETSTATVTIAVAAVNDVPVASADSGAGFSTNEDTGFTTGDVLSNDTLGDPPTTITAFDATSANGATVAYNNDGTFTYTPAAGFNGNDTFTYTITDTDGETSTATVTIAVGAVNDVPVAADDSGVGFSTNEDTGFTTGNVLTNDSLGDAPTTITAFDATSANGASVVYNNDGTFTYTPAANVNGNDTFTYTITDTDGETSTATVTIAVAAVNDVPVASADSGAGFSTNEDTGFTTGDVLSNDTLGDPPTTITAFDATSANGATVAYNNDGTFTYTPAAGFNGNDTFTYTITDTDGETSTATVTIAVGAVNDVPVAADDSGVGFSTNEDTGFTTGNVLTNDSLGDAPTTITAFDATSANGASVVYNNDGTFTYTPAANVNGNDTFTYTITDTDGETSTATVTIAVAAVNDVPTIGGANTGAVTKDVDPDGDGLLEVGGVLTISDPDPAESSFQAGTIVGTYGSLTIDAAGNWNYAADNSQAAVQQLNTGESISDVLTVTTADGTTHSIIVTINGATVIVDQGGDDPGPIPVDELIEPDPEPEPELPPDEILPVEKDQQLRVELAISTISSSKPPVTTPLQLADPTYFVPTISLLKTDNGYPTDAGSPSAMASIVKYLQRELASQTIERVASSVSALFSTEAMTHTLDHLQQQLGQTLEIDGKRGKLIIGAATGLGASVFAGYVIWAFRGTSLLLGALTAMPMWRCFDPLPVLMGNDKKRRDRDEAKTTQHGLDNDEIRVKELLGEERVARDVEGSIG